MLRGKKVVHENIQNMAAHAVASPAYYLIFFRHSSALSYIYWSYSTLPAPHLLQKHTFFNRENKHFIVSLTATLEFVVSNKI